MIISERIGENLIKHYSDTENTKLLQVETGIIYDEAVDTYPCQYTYSEVRADEETEN